jgi:hypothetical protein
MVAIAVEESCILSDECVFRFETRPGIDDEVRETVKSRWWVEECSSFHCIRYNGLVAVNYQKFFNAVLEPRSLGVCGIQCRLPWMTRNAYAALKISIAFISSMRI